MVDEPRALLAELRRRGGWVELTADSAVFKAPKTAITPELEAATSAHRAAIAALVVEESLQAIGLLRCGECRRIMPGYYLAGGICDECHVMPTVGDLFEEAR